MIQQNTLIPGKRELLSYSPLQYMLAAVAENPQLAHIYTDSEYKPACCALLFGHSLWLAGNVAGNAEAIGNILNHSGMDVLIALYDTPATAAAIRARYPAVYDNMRSVYRQSPPITW